MEIQIHETSKEKPSGKETQITVRTAVSCWTIKMEAMKNVRSAHVFDLKLLKESYLVLGIYCNIHTIWEVSMSKGKYHKKQFDLFYLVFNS